MKELEDYSWFPQWMRNNQTDYIGYIAACTGIYKTLARYINIHPVKSQRIFDLCSGSGAPAKFLFQHTVQFSELTCSDKFPNVRADATLPYQTIDVLHLHPDPACCYTIFNSFHHFSDAEKIQLVRKIGTSKASAFIVELFQPRIWDLFKVTVAATLGVLIFTPFIPHVRFRNLFFTYVIPFNIFLIAYDGIVSVLRSRSVAHYRKLFRDPHVKVFRLGNCISPLIIIAINHDEDAIGSLGIQQTAHHNR